MFTVNGKEYEEKELTFGMIRKMEKLGFSLLNDDIMSHLIDGATIYFALCSGETLSYAEKEIDESGDIMAIAEVFGKAVENSGFLQKMTAQGEKQEKKKSNTKA